MRLTGDDGAADVSVSYILTRQTIHLNKWNVLMMCFCKKFMKLVCAGDNCNYFVVNNTHIS